MKERKLHIIGSVYQQLKAAMRFGEKKMPLVEEQDNGKKDGFTLDMEEAGTDARCFR
jgi:hypothetical protein